MPAHKLDDQNLRDRLCDLIRIGHGRYEAAVAVGLTAETYRRYYKKNADFREQVEAAMHASAEPIMKILRTEAELGDVGAIREYLKHNAPAPASEVHTIEHKHELTVDAETLTTIADLRARLDGRSAPALPEADYVIEYEDTDEGDDAHAEHGEQST